MTIMQHTRSKNGGADDNATNDDGMTPFEILLTSQTPLDIKNYMESGGSINHFNSVNNTGCMAMMMMIHQMYEETIASASNLQPDSMGRTAIHNVISFRSKGGMNFIKLEMIIKSLLSMGGEINCQDHLGKTPLHYAVYFHNKRAVSLLLRCGANIDVTDIDGNSALGLSLSFSKSRLTAEQIKSNKKVIKILMVHLNQLALKGFHISKHNKEMMFKACELYHMDKKNIGKFFLKFLK